MSYTIVNVQKHTHCIEVYAGETTCRICESPIDHTDKDMSSHLFKYGVESGHKTSEINSDNIIGKSFRNDNFMRKVAVVIAYQRK